MRTEGDQWDITTSVGATALGVAAARAVESQRSAPLVDDPFAQAFLDRAELELALPGSEAADPDTEQVWETMSTYMGVRSRFFDEFFASATATGLRQVVLLAAGLDTRAYRLPWPDGVTVYEIDQPAVLRFKDDVLTDRAARTRAHRIPVTVDLREDWPAALRAAGFAPSAPTAWLAEGLLPYLPTHAETALFEHVERLSAPGSRIAVEHFAGSLSDMAQLMNDRMARVSTMFSVDVRDLVYLEERDHTPEASLARLGWKTLSASPRELAVAYQRPLPDDIVEVMSTGRLLEATRLPD